MSGEPAIRVLPLQRNSIPEIVDIHIRAFPSFFLSRMGPSVLRIFYRGFIGVDDVIAVQVEMDGQVVGAAVGPVNPRGFFRRLVHRDWFRFGIASLGFMIMNPTQIPRVLRALRYRGDGVGGDGALLSSIAVDPDCQGRGVGRILLRGWESSALTHGCVAAYLTTDATDNERTLTFYREAGWTIDRLFHTPEGRSMRLLLRSLEGQDQEADSTGHSVDCS